MGKFYLLLAFSLSSFTAFAQTPSWKTVLFENFGDPIGAELICTTPAVNISPGTTNYTPRTQNAVNDGTYGLVTTPDAVDDFDGTYFNQWLNNGDHTSGTGFMMIINANLNKKGEANGSYYVYTTNSLDLPGATYRIQLFAANLLGPAAPAISKDGYLGIAVRDNELGQGILYNQNSTNSWILSRLNTNNRNSPLPWQELNSEFTLPIDYAAPQLMFNFYNIDSDITMDAGNDLAIDDIRIEMRVVKFEGTIFNDKNGNGIRDVGEDVISKGANDLPIYAYITKSNGAVISKVLVQNDGSYVFQNDQGVPYSTNDIGLKIVFTTADVPLESALSSNGIDGFKVLNEIGAPLIVGVSAGTSTTDGVLQITNASVDRSNINLGINAIPVANNINYTMPYTPTYLSVIPFDGTALPLFNGSDLEDRPTASALLDETINITQLPTHGTLLYNGTAIQFGQDGVNPVSMNNPFVINNFNQQNLSIQISGHNVSNTVFSYQYVDKTGIVSQPATYTLQFPQPLTLEITDFNISKTSECEYLVSWISNDAASVINYEIESSFDGKKFFSIASIIATGSSSLYEQFINIKEPYHYFRLKISHDNGRIDYSNIVAFKTQCTSHMVISVYPNPSQKSISIEGLNQNDKLFVFDQLGRHIFQMSAQQLRENIDISTWANGMYTIKVITDEGSHQIIKFVKGQ